MSERATTPTASVSRARAGRDIAGQAVLRAANLTLGIGVTVLVVRTLGDEGFGQWSTILAVLNFVGYLGILGLEQVTVERASADPAAQPGWLGALLTLRLALSVPTALISVAVCLWLADDPDMRVASLVVCAALPFVAFSAARVAFQLQVRNTVATAIEMANGIAWGVAVALVAALDGDVVAMASAFVVVNTAAYLATFAVAARSTPIRMRGSRDRWPVLLRLGLPVGVGGVLILGYGYIDQVLVFEFAGARDAGLYGAVYRILERAQFLPATLMTTLFPIFVAARREDPERVPRLFRTAVDWLVLTTVPAFAIAAAGPEPIVRLLFGPEFIAAAPALPVLMAALVVISIGYLTGNLIVAYRLQRQFVVIALAALAFNVAANLVLVPRYGFLAAAWITLATEVLVTSLSLTMVCRRAGLTPAGAHLGRILGAALGAGLLAWTLRQAGLPVLVWTSAAAAAYAGALLAVGAVSPSDLRALALRRSVT